MVGPRSANAKLVILVVLVLAVGVLPGCVSKNRQIFGDLPPDLPSDPEPCTTYCRVWVPPVYRDVPKLVTKCPPTKRMVPETICRTRFEDVCVKPREQKICRTSDLQCDQALVQVRPGGYKWKKADGTDCWQYCYEPPCYQWCNKVVTDKGIEYCTEVPPQYETRAYTEAVQVMREECVPGEYEVEWVKEVYIPGHWEWQPTKNCDDCICDAPCPTMPRKPQPCSRASISEGVPRCN